MQINHRLHPFFSPTILLFVLVFCLPVPYVIAQNHVGYMYGRVTTQTNTYEGQIRWGEEESCWTDYFNASKKEPATFKKYQPEPVKTDDSWLDLNWDLESIWKDKVELVRQFNCQFGDIKELRVTGESNARLRFRNGMELDVLGEGYNDIGTKVQILDKELGLTAINWDRIEKIDFMPCPKKLNPALGEPLYGIVESNRKEKFTGYIQWDHDERFAADKLDGYTPDGKISVAFSEIESIEKKGNASLITLFSGRELLMNGTNDVNATNRGLFIVMPEKCMVDMPWSAFKKVVFTRKTDTGPSYESFGIPRQLAGTVSRLSDGEISGRIIYDLDESLDLETLEGSDNGLKYTVPFRNIKKIKPKNTDYSFVELRNGESLFLGGSNDVSDGNSGIMVIRKGEKKPIYIRWDNVDEITFE